MHNILDIYNERYKHLGLRIGYYRKKHNLTQAQLASRTGISEAYLSQIERGVAQGVSLSLYWGICSEINVDLSELLKDL